MVSLSVSYPLRKAGNDAVIALEPAGNTFVRLIVSVFAYVSLEWLFFETKLSFLSPLSFLNQVLTWHAAVAAVLVLLLVPQALASGIGRAIGRWRREAGKVIRALPAAFILSSLALILIDNFTHTVLKLEIANTGIIGRLLYAALFSILLVITTRYVKDETTSSQPIVRRVAMLILAVGVIALIALYVGGVQETIPDEPIPHPVRRPNILLLASDGVSALHLSAYGYERDTTPFLRSLRPNTLLCENAFSNVGRTYGSMISMLTGMTPTATRAPYPPNLLLGQQAFASLPHLLRQAGYTSLQVTMRYYADMPDADMLLAFDYANFRKVNPFIPALLRRGNAYGLLTTRFLIVEMQERLFERLGHVFAGQRMENGYKFVVDQERSPYYADGWRIREVLRLIDETPSPWFLHVHLMDTHCCLWGLQPGASQQQQVEAFDRSIRASDSYLEQIIAELKKRGLLTNTLVVISSDHAASWDTRGRVPLMFAFPDGRPRGVVRENVELLDVAPTILDYLGVKPPSWMTGRSLLHGIRERPIFSLNRMDLTLNSLNPNMEQLSAPGPPWFGAASAVVVLCNRWYELDLSNGKMDSDEIAGSTRDCPQPAITTDEARRMILEYLHSGGFGAKE